MKRKIVLLLLSTKLHTIERIVLWFLSRKHKEFYSLLLREIFKEIKGVDIGLYTHGACFKPGYFARHTKIGRYCSIASNARAFNRNHPLNFKSTHAFFFNTELGYCKEDMVPYIPLEIGHDVWIGSNAVILPTANTIGTGAVIAAGAVVNKSIPPYAVVAGNPARIVRYRFSPDVIKKLLESKWWEMSIEEIRNKGFDKFTQPYENLDTDHDGQSKPKQPL